MQEPGVVSASESEVGHPHLHQCDYDVGHAHEEAADTDAPDAFRQIERKKLLWAIALTGAMMVVEAVGGVLTNSLALISDAGHMLTHLLALLLSLASIVLAGRPPTKEKTFGFYRLEILGALLNGVMLLLITAWIVYEVYQRLLTPKEVASLQMLGIAFAGLAVNLVTAVILSGRGIGSLISRSARLHVLGDAASSLAVVIGAVLIYFTGLSAIDPILSVLICVVVLIWAYQLIMEAVEVLLEATPRDVTYDEVKKAIAVLDEVEEVHDLHIWTLTSGLYALSAHIRVRDMPLSETAPLLRKLNFILCQRFRIGHTAVQFECGNGRGSSAVEAAAYPAQRGVT